MPRHNSKRKGHEFILSEAEGSGSEREHADDGDLSDPEENSEDRAFIDDQALIVYQPPPIPPLFVQEYIDRHRITIEEVSDASTPPPPPPPPGAKSAPAFQKSKLTSFYKPSGVQPAKPPAGVSKPAAPPPPTDPPVDPPVKLRRPKARAPKKLTALIQSHLVPAAEVGSLTYNLVTVIPDIECSIEDSWKGIREAYQKVKEQLALLIGLHGAFLCIETHGETHRSVEARAPKKKKNAKDPAAAPEQTDLDFFEMNDGTLAGEDPVQYMKATRSNKLTGKAHMHVLCWYSDYHFPRVDFSALKRALLSIFRNGDVHEVKMRDTVRNKTSHYVRATAYVFKSIECPATLENWHKHIDPNGTPPLPEFYHGAPFRNDAPLTECIRRWLLFLREAAQWCLFALDTSQGRANVFFTEENRMSPEEKEMRSFAEMLRQLGIIVSPSPERGGERYYELEKRTEYRVLRSVGPGHTSYWLSQRLQAVPQAIGMYLKWESRLPIWCRMTSVFDSLEKQTYDWVELIDGYYNIHTNLFREKNNDDYEFIKPCFRSYNISIKQLQETKPKAWLQLLEYACTPVPKPRLVVPASPFDVATTEYEQLDKHRLLVDFARLLNRRQPKQPVPFLWGVSNSGKTTLSSFIRCLYPIEAMAAINNSSAPFSGINEDTQLVYNEEFKCETISREELLVLLDGAQPLTVRKLHQDARLIANPLMPILLQDNYYPTYYHDDSRALENRLSLHYFPRSIGTVDLGAYKRIADEHLFVVRYLHEYLARTHA